MSVKQQGKPRGEGAERASPWRSAASGPHSGGPKGPGSTPGLGAVLVRSNLVGIPGLKA